MKKLAISPKSHGRYRVMDVNPVLCDNIHIEYIHCEYILIESVSNGILN